MKIFLIEDDEIYAEFVKKALGQNADYKIDYKLPGMSGHELYEKIKSKIGNENKIIMLSALDDGNMVLSFIQKGVRDYVIKDENVIESLESILAGKEDDYYLFD